MSLCPHSETGIRQRDVHRASYNQQCLPGGGQGYHRDCDTHVSREGLASQWAGCLLQRGCKHSPESRQKFPGWQSNYASPKCVKTTDDSVSGRRGSWLRQSLSGPRQIDSLFTLSTPHCPGGGNLLTAHSPYPFLSTLPLPFSPPPTIFLRHAKRRKSQRT